MSGYGKTMRIQQIQIQDPGSRMNIPDLILENLVPVSVFGLKILKFFDADLDPGSGRYVVNLGSEMVKVESGIRDKHPGSSTLESTKLFNQQSKIT
jgi:hypothetical protein